MSYYSMVDYQTCDYLTGIRYIHKLCHHMKHIDCGLTVCDRITCNAFKTSCTRSYYTWL